MLWKMIEPMASLSHPHHTDKNIFLYNFRAIKDEINIKYCKMEVTLISTKSS
jgi:hypothetical protein